MVQIERLRAYLRVHLADGVGAKTLRRLMDAFGDVEALLAASPAAWRRVEGVGEKKAAAIASVTDEQIDAELDAARQRQVTILTTEDDAFPAALKTIYDCPAVLYVRGALEPTDALALGVVGSRRCTHYGLEQAERFAALLGQAGFTVVSGGARGIDTAAHRGALAAGGRTIAVMGCGLCGAYPPENEKLFSRIAAEGRGALVSELPMRTTVLKGSFPTRNRLISGLSLGVLVVEAARRSGSLITARLAVEQGRGVFAVPGRADSPLSQGSNELIRDGVTLVQSLEDILEDLGRVGQEMKASESETVRAPAVAAGLDDTERKLWEILADGPLGLDELIRRSGVESGRAASAMTMLVLKGAARQEAGNVFGRG